MQIELPGKEWLRVAGVLTWASIRSLNMPGHPPCPVNEQSLTGLQEGIYDVWHKSVAAPNSVEFTHDAAKEAVLAVRLKRGDLAMIRLCFRAAIEDLAHDPVELRAIVNCGSDDLVKLESIFAAVNE
jgi:hypothetical protein